MAGVRLVALLRGINVGRSRRLPMPRLREIAEACGLRDVRTYIQSGNLVATSPDGDMAQVREALEDGIERELGSPVRVIVLSAEELAAVIAANPFAGRDAEPRQLHAVFLPPGHDLGAIELDPAAYAPEEWCVAGQTCYLYLPDGIGRSKLAAALATRGASSGTARNWRTIETLAAWATKAI